MDSPHSPKPQERRGIRYALHLPVSLTLAHRKFHARSESISLGGILLSSDFLVPEGSEVEVQVRVAQLPQPGTYLTARGKVLWARPNATGDYSVAVAFEREIEFRWADLQLGAARSDMTCGQTPAVQPSVTSRLPPREKFVTARGPRLGSAWIMET